MRGKFSVKTTPVSKARFVTIATRVTSDERIAMDAICARNKISRSEAVRRILLGIDDKTFKKIIAV